MKVLLVFPNQMRFPKEFDKITTIQKEAMLLPPLGLLYIKSNSKYNPDIIDNRIEQLSDKKLFEKCMEYDVICFGGMITEIVQARNVSKMLRDAEKTTIYGGPNATVNARKYIKDFDIIIRGEGEILLDKVLDAKNNHNVLAETPGVSFIGKDGNAVHTKDSEFMLTQDLDKLKYPAREDIDMTKYYRSLEPYASGICDTIVSSRGCPFLCTFCSSKYLWKQKWRTRSDENIIEEIKYLQNNFGTKNIYFREDNFTINRNRLVSLCEKMIPLGIKWACESRVNTIDPEVLALMKKAGCEIIWFGIESTNNETLKIIKKFITIDQAKKAVDMCHEAGIQAGAGFIIGFPHETKEDIKQTLKDCRKLGLDKVYINRFLAIPISEMYIEVEQKKLGKHRFEDIIIPHTEHVDADEVTELAYKAVLSPLQRFTYSLPLPIKEWFKRHFKGPFYWLARKVYK